MECPLCHATMSPQPPPSLARRIDRVLFQSPPDPRPHFVCAACKITVYAPFWDHPFSHHVTIDTLEDFRSNKAAHAARMRAARELIGDAWTENQQSWLKDLECTLRFLDAMTPEERSSCNAPSAERQAELATATGITQRDIAEIVYVFQTELACSRHRRQHPIGSRQWQGPVAFGVALAVSIGACVIAHWNDLIAIALTALFYFLLGTLCVGAVGFCSSRLTNRIFGSWWWFVPLALVAPVVIGAVVYWQLSEFVARTLAPNTVLVFGACALFWLLVLAYFTYATNRSIRRTTRALREVLGAIPPPEPPQGA